MMKTPKNQQSLVNSWNRKHAIGTPVCVTLDGGGTINTKTKTLALLAAGHTAFIGVEDGEGSYKLSRVTAI